MHIKDMLSYCKINVKSYFLKMETPSNNEHTELLGVWRAVLLYRF